MLLKETIQHSFSVYDICLSSHPRVRQPRGQPACESGQWSQAGSSSHVSHPQGLASEIPQFNVVSPPRRGVKWRRTSAQRSLCPFVFTASKMPVQEMRLLAPGSSATHSAIWSMGQHSRGRKQFLGLGWAAQTAPSSEWGINEVNKTSEINSLAVLKK